MVALGGDGVFCVLSCVSRVCVCVITGRGGCVGVLCVFLDGPTDDGCSDFPRDDGGGLGVREGACGAFRSVFFLCACDVLLLLLGARVPCVLCMMVSESEVIISRGSNSN